MGSGSRVFVRIPGHVFVGHQQSGSGEVRHTTRGILQVSLKNDIHYTLPDEWYTVMENGKAVVLVYEPNKIIHDPANGGILQRCRRELKLWNYKEVTKEEFETLGAICDLPEIDITEFIDWEKRYVNGITGSEDTGSHDTERASGKGLSGLYQRWRVFWL